MFEAPGDYTWRDDAPEVWATTTGKTVFTR
jgi:hypothetical protein